MVGNSKLKEAKPLGRSGPHPEKYANRLLGSTRKPASSSQSSVFSNDSARIALSFEFARLRNFILPRPCFGRLEPATGSLSEIRVQTERQTSKEAWTPTATFSTRLGILLSFSFITLSLQTAEKYLPSLNGRIRPEA